MSYTAEILIKMLQGDWVMSSHGKRHYLILKHKKEMDTFRSKHRSGTFTLEQRNNEWILQLSSATHERILDIVDADHIRMKIDMNGKDVVYSYKRDKNIFSKLRRRLKK